MKVSESLVKLKIVGVKMNENLKRVTFREGLGTLSNESHERPG